MAPRPDSLLIMNRSAMQGWRAGSAAALGIGSGTFVHIFAAAFGLSAVLASSAAVFTVVKYFGATYLLYIGIGLLRSKRKHSSEAEAPPALPSPLPYRKIFIQGFPTNVLNLKMVVFFLAFVPQFIAPECLNKALAFVALGCLFNFNGMLWCHFLAVATAFTSRRIRVNTLVTFWVNRFIGAMFVSFGVKLALSKRS